MPRSRGGKGPHCQTPANTANLEGEPVTYAPEPAAVQACTTDAALP